MENVDQWVDAPKEPRGLVTCAKSYTQMGNAHPTRGPCSHLMGRHAQMFMQVHNSLQCQQMHTLAVTAPVDPTRSLVRFLPMNVEFGWSPQIGKLWDVAREQQQHPDGPDVSKLSDHGHDFQSQSIPRTHLSLHFISQGITDHHENKECSFEWRHFKYPGLSCIMVSSTCSFVTNELSLFSPVSFGV